ncbi:MAG: 5-bromo-4-chloroindolyl phosphate hydrolysis family protein [Oscillospiraceae bacterium]|nr:5-bromo-4-chloroindolyl phosphate hydrolysis family protein [Oscillospiraceae bacterium]
MNRHDDQHFLHSVIYWVITLVLLFSPLFPVGAFLLIRKLIVNHRRPYVAPHSWQAQAGTPPPEADATVKKGKGAAKGAEKKAKGAAATAQLKRPNAKRGKALMILGGILAAVFAFVLAIVLGPGLMSSGLIAIIQFSPLWAFLVIGLAMFGVGNSANKREKRFSKYLALIGRHKEIPVEQLASAMPISVQKASADLEAMLSEGYLPTGYVDWMRGVLVLSDEGMSNPPPEEETPKNQDDDDKILNEIRLINDLIEDAAMSRKIDRIGEISSKIFSYQREHPAKSAQLRTFLSYYLPATLKILRAYAQLEAQGIEGDNITAAKTRIEQMMDKVVEGFEKQLDRLFQGDVLDITADVEVLERMLSKDGLSGGGGMTLGG